MSRIVTFGAAGTAGARVVAEAAARGHDVTAVARQEGRLRDLPPGVEAAVGDATRLDSVTAFAKDADVLVLTIGGNPEVYTRVVATVAAAARSLPSKELRVLHMGGGSSLLNEDGVTFYEAPGFPEEYKPHARGQLKALEAYRALGDEVTWTYLSPPPIHFAPGARTGRYRTGSDHPVVGSDGRASISYEDFAVALVDEIENPRHLNKRFTVGY
ncbi:NAD(P)-dependent oxidoreductase [Streptomyces sp. NPDC091281]|uniref:NAD(P)-dependent oxidoreductase n=1 Tax=Streptomyces sp. NPDC091281 TaxID=3365985 RepID=UPI00380A8AC1